ncbi:MAG: rhomboid family intramembrane serine protease [Planctomycetota bacterium]
MSWQDRGYSGGEGYGTAPAGGGLRSWFGGLPSPGKAVKWIAIANIIMYLLCMITGGFGSPVYGLLAMETELVQQGQVWRLFTFTYLHDQSSVFHILFNLIGLYFLGMSLERQWGPRRFFVFYTIGGFVGVILYFVLTSVGWLDPHGILVGASGGVLALLGACAVLFPRIQIIMVFFPVPIRLAALILVVLYAMNIGGAGGNAGGDACHLAGLAFGIFWGYRGRNFSGTMDRWRRNRARGAFEAKQRRLHALNQEVDRILQKVNEQGVNSLSRAEKRKLAEASQRQRESDRHYGT